MRFLLITDAWSPQTNGVVTTLKTVIAELESKGFEVKVIEPGLFRTFPLPSYPEIRLAFLPGKKIKKIVESYQPHYIHIATEGTLGLSAKRYLDKHGWRYTTSLHTKFPEYANKRLPLFKVSWGYALLKWFHKRSAAIMVTTPSMKRELVENGLNTEKMVVWGRGVDTEKYHADAAIKRDGDSPVYLYVGRLAVEKNLTAFLDCPLKGTKRLIGDGPQANSLKQRYPDVQFPGYRYGDDLVAEYQRADVFVFPSKTDTFGLVMLEALACGTPVAAYPVAGPIDVIENGVTGVLDEDLPTAIEGALTLDREQCRAFAESQSWQAVAQRLIDQLVLNDRA